MNFQNKIKVYKSNLIENQVLISCHLHPKNVWFLFL